MFHMFYTMFYETKVNQYKIQTYVNKLCKNYQ